MNQRASRYPQRSQELNARQGPTDTAQASGPGASSAACSQFSTDCSAVTVSFAVPLRRPGMRPERNRSHLLRSGWLDPHGGGDRAQGQQHERHRLLAHQEPALGPRRAIRRCGERRIWPTSVPWTRQRRCRPGCACIWSLIAAARRVPVADQCHTPTE